MSQEVPPAAHQPREVEETAVEAETSNSTQNNKQQRKRTAPDDELESVEYDSEPTYEKGLFTTRRGVEKFWLHKSCQADSAALIDAIKAEGGETVKRRAQAHISLFANAWEFPIDIEQAREKSLFPSFLPATPPDRACPTDSEPVLANWIGEVRAAHEQYRARPEPKKKFTRGYFCNNIRSLPSEKAARVDYTPEEIQEVVERLARYPTTKSKTPAKLKPLWASLAAKVRPLHSSFARRLLTDYAMQPGAKHSAESYFDHYKARKAIYDVDSAKWRVAHRHEWHGGEGPVLVPPPPRRQVIEEESEEEEEEEQVLASTARSIKKSQSQAEKPTQAKKSTQAAESDEEEEDELEEVDELDESPPPLPDIVKGKLVGGMRGRGDYSSPVKSVAKSRKTM